MKKISILLFFTFLQVGLYAQVKDSLAPYLQVPFVPPFQLLLADSTLYAKQDLPKNKPLVIFYFNPDCGHCQIQIKELADSMQLVQKAIFILASSRPLPDIATFAATNNLQRFKNLIIGKEVKSFLPSFYKIEFTPFVAVYNKKGKLLEAYQHGFSVSALTKLLK